MNSKHNELARQKVFVVIGEFSDYFNLPEVLSAIERKGVDNSCIEFENDYDTTRFGYYRNETDEEYEKRIKPYTARLKKKEENERKLYLKLKEKFESEVK